MANLDKETSDFTMSPGADVEQQEADADALRAALERSRAEHEQELQTLKAELEAAQDQLMRRAAEFQNYRRRTEQERGQLFEMGKSAAIQAMLDVLDDFERSLTAAGQLGDKATNRTFHQAAL
jgi:molecular chaperone GrpE